VLDHSRPNAAAAATSAASTGKGVTSNGDVPDAGVATVTGLAAVGALAPSAGPLGSAAVVALAGALSAAATGATAGVAGVGTAADAGDLAGPAVMGGGTSVTGGRPARQGAAVTPHSFKNI
jgi:hypothetical protein